MKAIQLKQFGIKNLVVTNEKNPTPGPYEVLVKLEAASLNYIDLALIKGFYNPTISLPRIPGSEGSGVIEAVGGEVTRWKKGDRVTTNFYQKWLSGKRIPAIANSQVSQATQGVLAEYVCLHEEGLVNTPPHLSCEEASTLSIAGATAWNGLVALADLKPGQAIVTQGSGGVSVFALQIAKMMSAKVIATSSSKEKIDRLIKLGADEVINYKEYANWHEEVRRITKNEGVDAILDIGGAQTIGSTLLSLKMHGFAGIVGYLGGPTLPIDFFRTVTASLQIQGISASSRETFEAFCRAALSSGLRPTIDTVFPLEETQDALHLLESGNFVGKIVVKI